MDDPALDHVTEQLRTVLVPFGQVEVASAPPGTQPRKDSTNAFRRRRPCLARFAGLEPFLLPARSAHLHQRGLALVLDYPNGAVTGPGMVRSARGVSRFSGLGIVDFADRSHAVAVVALDLDAKDNFARGDMASFAPESNAA